MAIQLINEITWSNDSQKIVNQSACLFICYTR